MTITLPNGSPDDETLPTYSESDDKLSTTLELLIFAAEADEPIQSYPEADFWTPIEERDPKVRARQQIVDCFFDAVTHKRDEIVAALIDKKLVTANTTNSTRQTPLLAAVAAGNARMVQELVDFGAVIDDYGYHSDLYRTPLQLAAATGNLNIVKLLIEAYKADDSLIAPDGELALHLAVKNGHREVVDYLPLRRGGGWLRWKTQHANAVRRAGKVVKGLYIFFKFFLFDVPKFFVWSIPKHTIVKPTYRVTRWAWKHQKEAARWCGKKLVAIPKKALAGGKKVWGGVKKIPNVTAKVAKGIWKVIKATPGAIKALLVWIWKVIKAVPKALGVVALWMWTGVKATGTWIYSVLERVASFLHTTVSAIFSFFRNITFQDVVNSFSHVLRAIFVELPKTLWRWASNFGNVTFDVMNTLFGGIGRCVWYIVAAILAVVTYVPRKIGAVFLIMAKSLVEGYREILVWINPKR